MFRLVFLSVFICTGVLYIFKNQIHRTATPRKTTKLRKNAKNKNACVLKLGKKHFFHNLKILKLKMNRIIVKNHILKIEKSFEKYVQTIFYKFLRSKIKKIQNNMISWLKKLKKY
jgi:hypothetical protein